MRGSIRAVWCWSLFLGIAGTLALGCDVLGIGDRGVFMGGSGGGGSTPGEGGSGSTSGGEGVGSTSGEGEGGAQNSGGSTGSGIINCGNNKLDSGEMCDDDNTDNGDRCSADCQCGTAIPGNSGPDVGVIRAYSSGSSCYLLFENPLTDWDGAADVCDGLGMKLAAITSSFELGFLLLYNGEKNSWIGGNDRTNEGNYSWSTSENWWLERCDAIVSNCTPWGKGQPNDDKDQSMNDEQDCVLLSGGIGDFPVGLCDFECTEELGFVCEIVAQ